jgi:hypothetical protein
MTDYAELAAQVAACSDDTALIDLVTPVIAAMPKARRNQLLTSNPVRDPRKYDRCPKCTRDIERGWRHDCSIAGWRPPTAPKEKEAA